MPEKIAGALVTEEYVELTDNIPLQFGDGHDIKLEWDGSNLVATLATADTGQVQFGADDSGIDVVLYGDTSGAKATWDQSADELVIAGGANVRHTVDSANQVGFISGATVANTDTSAKDLFQIPGNANIVLAVVDVTTAFNDTGTNLLDIGKTGTGNHFIDNLDVSTTGQTVTGYSNLGDVGASAITVTATFAGGNGDSTTGAASVSFFWTVA